MDRWSLEKASCCITSTNNFERYFLFSALFLVEDGFARGDAK